MRPRSIVGLGFAALVLFSLLVAHHNDPPQAAPQVAQADPAPLSPPTPLADHATLSSTARCGCRLHLWDSYSQPEECRLKGSKPDLVGLEGYVRTSTAPVKLMSPPWSTSELKHSGPKKWDAISSPRRARAKVRILEVIYRESPEDDLLHAIARVVDVDGPKPRTSYIDLADFDAVPWWQCTADKAVEYSPIIAKAAPGSRPVDDEGRWVDLPMPARLWCWTYVNDAGVYCDPHTHGRGDMHDPTWHFKASDLTVEY